MARSLRNQSPNWTEMHGGQSRNPIDPGQCSPHNARPSTALERTMFDAIDQRCLEGVSRCLDDGANVNAVNGFFGETALHHAARVRWRAGVELLLNRGGQANIENRFLQTPLHFAAVSGSSECMSTLLARDKTALHSHDMRGYTPLHDAAIGSDPRCVQLLINAGADVNVVDKQVETPLHKCARSGVVASIVALLNEGADLKAKNREGETALAMILRNIPNALNRVFDHCVVPNKLPKNHKNFELTINFKPLIRASALSNIDILRSVIKIGEAEVLKHPVCQAFLELKWRHVVKLFVFKLLFYMVLVVLATMFTLNKFVWTDKCRSESECTNSTHTKQHRAREGANFELGYILYWIAVFMIAVLIITEVINILSSAANYFVDIMAYINWILFIMFFIISADSNGIWQVHVAAFYTLLLWSKVMHMIGQFPSCGIYVSMFAKVAKVICKMFFVYFSLLIAFSISFHICFRSPPFKNSGDAFMNTITLMIGEVDYKGLFDESQQYPPIFGTSHVIFFLFLILMSIILSNLLVALAVSDVQGLRQGAHLERLKKQSQLIHETELMRAFFKSVMRCQFSRSIIDKLLKSFHLDMLSTRVFMLPNHPQKARYLQILDYNTKTLTEHKVSKDMQELFWSALQRQENVDCLVGHGPPRSSSVLSKRASLCRRSTVRPIKDDGALRAHRGREVATPRAINFDDFKDLINSMETRLSEQMERRFNEIRRTSTYGANRSNSLWLQTTTTSQDLGNQR